MLRKAVHLNQQELAEKLGLASFDCISKWEQGKIYPSLENLAKLCRVFNVKAGDIYPELFKSMKDGFTSVTQAESSTELRM